MTKLSWYLNFIAWFIACIAMGGSLFFSEIMEFPPCQLCWYQRIAMYPLVLILLPPLTGIVKSRDAFFYTIPIAIIGWLIALYHNLLHFKIIPESASPCRAGVSCTDVYLDLLGFITIPLMSFFAFTLIVSILVINYRKSNS